MRWVAVLVAVLAVAVSIPRAAAEGSYSPPVDGAIVDHFRPPSTPYGPGNRGVDFQTNPGDPVRAAADGEVVFAGRVGFSQHVVVLHPDGLRTSYSFLTEVDVQRGDRVHRGDVVGRSGNELHFGVRAGDKYLDPEPLLAGAPPDVHLIPVEDRKPGSILSEVLGLAAGISGTVIHASAKGVQWAGEQVVDAGTAAYDLVVDQARSVIAIVDAFQYYSGLPYLEAEKLARSGLFYDAQRHCTPASVAPGVEAGGRHIAVLVGGLGSSSTSANILDVDTRALGYAHDDVAVFSYAGGQTGGTRHLSGVAQHDYDTKDADEDLRTSAKRLRDLLVSIRLTHPGVPVDIIAHSQGGLVVRDALGEPGDEINPTLPTIDHVITLASPHHGANLATGNQWIGTSTDIQEHREALMRSRRWAWTSPLRPCAISRSAHRSSPRSTGGRCRRARG